MSEVYFGEVSDEFRQWCEENYPVGPVVTNPLCFTANEPNANVSLIGYDLFEEEQLDIWCHLQYSTDNKETWNTYSGQIVYLDQCYDKKVYFRADPQNPNTNGFYKDWKAHKFVIVGSVAASGNIQYLLTSNGTLTTVPEQSYGGMFYDCQTLTQAPELPATSLSYQCYLFMFYNCTSLTAAPHLPATTLANQCYVSIFGDCQGFSEVHMKQSVEGVYNSQIHGGVEKTVIYDL